MVEQALSLRGVATHKSEMLTNALQMVETSLFVLRIIVDLNRQQAQLRAKRFNDRRREIPCIGEEIAMPPKSTKLDRKAQFIGRAAALVYLCQICLGEREVLADGVVVNLIGQVLGFLQFRWGIVPTRRIQGFVPPMARV